MARRSTLGDLVLDNEAPRVEAVNPADGAGNVGAGNPIVITFNEAMSSASFTDANVRVLLGSAVVAVTRLCRRTGAR